MPWLVKGVLGPAPAPRFVPNPQEPSQKYRCEPGPYHAIVFPIDVFDQKSMSLFVRFENEWAEACNSASASMHGLFATYIWLECVREILPNTSRPSSPSSIMAPGSVEKEWSISCIEEKKSKPRVAAYTLDTAATLATAEDTTLTPEEAQKLRRKIDLHILPLMFSEPTLIYAARRARLTLGSSPLLGSVHGQNHFGVFLDLGHPEGYQTHY